MENEFYTTLLSNSSMDYNPNNTTSGFNVHLAKEINLEGKWVVGVTEVTYPNMFHNVSIGHNHIIIQYKTFIEGAGLITCAEQKLEVKIDSFPLIEDLISAVNRAFNDVFKINLFKKKASAYGCLEWNVGEIETLQLFNMKDSISKYTSVRMQTPSELIKSILDGNASEYIDARIISFDPHGKISDESITIEFEGRLASQLGFIPNTKVKFDDIPAPYPPLLVHGIPPEIFIYMDVIEPQIISNASSQVARIVKTLDEKTSYGGVVVHEFAHRNYLPLIKNRFQSIRMELRDSIGAFIPFVFGTSTATLHFKKIS